MEDNEKYQYNSKDEYSSINKQIVSNQKHLHETKQNSIYYSVEIKYYKYYEMYYIIMPQEYLSQIERLRQNKEDIFSKGKILTFSKDNKNFSFDAVIDSTEEKYAYLVPIQEKYRYSKNLEGEYMTNERTGDLTYYRMEQAINEFVNGNCCSNIIENYILGNNIFKNNRRLYDLFNFNRYYPTRIRNFSGLTRDQEKKMKKIFLNYMNTIELSSDSDKKIISLIIYALYNMRRNFKDKILICSSSNVVADSISLDLLKLKKIVKELNILRIYAKNQEIIKRNKKLYEISFHKIMKKNLRKKFYDKYEKADWIINNNDIIISTCVNSYNDDIINYQFPFVVIIDANNSNENECLIPITLKAKHVVLISYEGSDNNELNLYKRMEHLYPNNHIKI